MPFLSSHVTGAFKTMVMTTAKKNKSITCIVSKANQIAIKRPAARYTSFDSDLYSAFMGKSYGFLL
jgi:hypothetical protein